jgi:hypothetical protein
MIEQDNFKKIDIRAADGYTRCRSNHFCVTAMCDFSAGEVAGVDI